MRNSTRHPVFLAGILLLVLLSFMAIPARSGELGASDGQLLEQELERTDSVLERVGDLVGERDQPKPAQLYEEARKIQSLAWDLFRREINVDVMSRQEKMRILALTRRSRDMGLRIQRELREGVTLEERARQIIERTRNFVERALDRPDAMEQARVRSVVEEAQRQLDSAERQFADGNYDIAIRLAESAREMLSTLLQEARQQVSPQRAEQALTRTRALIQRAREHAEEIGPTGMQVLERAEGAQARAEQAYRDEQYGLSLELTRESRLLLRALLERAGQMVSAADVQRALDRFDARYERLRERAGNSTGAAGDLLNQAVEARHRAVESTEAGDQTTALTHVRVGMDLLNRAAQLLGDERP